MRFSLESESEETDGTDEPTTHASGKPATTSSSESAQHSDAASDALADEQQFITAYPDTDLTVMADTDDVEYFLLAAADNNLEQFDVIQAAEESHWEDA